jgi:hypothetical protein
MTCGTKDGQIHGYTPLKAIRRKCLDCCYGSPQEVKLCEAHFCSLHPYRFGKNPKRKGIGGRLAKGEIPPGLQKFKDLSLPENSSGEK